jgi:CheY-like chemotaxis protein
MRTGVDRGMGEAHPKRTILIVEDDAELRDLITALLEDEQLDTVECESAEAALAVMLLHERDISMIFADVRLTGAMDGVDLAWEVGQRWPTLPVVLTSGRPSERSPRTPRRCRLSRKLGVRWAWERVEFKKRMDWGKRHLEGAVKRGRAVLATIDR